MLFAVVMFGSLRMRADDIGDDFIQHNLSYATATQSHEPSYSASNAIDGIQKEDPRAGWNNGELADVGEDNELTSGSNWWMVDLGESTPIDAIVIYFEGAFAVDFDIEFLNDEEEIIGVESINNNNDTEFGKVLSATQTARFVRLNFLKAFNSGWGIKFYEVELYVKKTAFDNAIVQAMSRLVKGVPMPVEFHVVSQDNVTMTIDIEDVKDLPGSLTYSDGLFTASTAGEYQVTVVFNGKDYKVTLSVDDAENLITTEGDFACTVTLNPTDLNLKNDADPSSNLFDLNEVTEIGWNGYVDLTTEPYYELDLKNSNSVRAILLGHTGATISGFDVLFYRPDGETKIGETYSYTNSGGAGTIQVLDFPESINGVRYIRLYPTALSTGYGACLCNFFAYGKVEEMVIDKVIVKPAESHAYVGTPVKIHVDVTFKNGTEIQDMSFEVVEDSLPEGLTYSVEDGTFTSEKAGEMKFEIKLSGDEFKDKIVDVVIIFEEKPECLFIRNGGLFDTLITAVPDLDYSGDLFIDEDIPDDINGAGGGWADKGLGEEHEIPDGTGLIYFDLRRKCKVTGAKFVHGNATISKFDIKFYSTDPKKPGATPIRTLRQDISPLEANEQTNYSEMIIFDTPVENVRYMVVDVKYLRMPEWGGRFREICLYGKGASMNDDIAYSGSSGYYVIKNDGLDKLVKGVVAYNSDGEILYELTDGISLSSDSDVLIISGNEITVAAGAPVGAYPLTISYTNPKSGEAEAFTENIEVVSADWKKRYNIARYNITTGIPENELDKGIGYGNPFAKAFHNSSTKGAVNQTIKGLIDGDWHGWNITAEELKNEKKPSLYLDFGFSLPVNEVAVYYNAFAADASDPDSYRMMRPSHYKIYGGNKRVSSSSAMKKAAPALTSSMTGDKLDDLVEWKELVEVTELREEDYGVPGRHSWNLDEDEVYRYLKFEFFDTANEGLGISISEIAVGGDKLQDEDGNPAEDILKATTSISVETPNFDRSNVVDRGMNNDWIVTSTRINDKLPLNLSYMYSSVYGQFAVLSTGEDISASYSFPEGVAGVKLMMEANMTDGSDTRTITKEVPFTGTYSSYHDIKWPIHIFDWPEKDMTGSAVITAIAVDENGDAVAESEPLTVMVLSNRGNINRFANAYDNAVQYSRYWNVDGHPDQKKGDRDLEYLGTDPSNAADGEYGSWYVIGYYGPGDSMGQTYKYNADEELVRPYELYIDYRSEDEENPDHPSTYAMEVDMLGFCYEGAFPRDYNVYILQVDDNGDIIKDENGNDMWVQVGSFVNMQNIGVGQTETHRIYPADTNGDPLVDENGHIIPWTNVAAVKIEFTKLGTPYGLKLFESAIYGKLNHYVLTTNIEQIVYTNPEGFFRGTSQAGNKNYHETEGVKNENFLIHRKDPLYQEPGLYYSFNLRLSTDAVETGAYDDVYNEEEINEIKDAFDKADSYRLRISKRKVVGYNIIDEDSGYQDDGTLIENGVQWTESRFVYGEENDDYAPRVFILSEEKSESGQVPYFVEKSRSETSVTKDGFLEFTIPAFGFLAETDGNDVASYRKVKEITDLVVQNVEPTYYYRIAGIDALNSSGEKIGELEFTPSERVRMVAPYVKYDVHSESFGFYAEKNIGGNSDDSDTGTGEVDFVNNDSEWTTSEEYGHHLGSVKGAHYATYTHANRVSLLGEFTQLMLTQQTLDAWDLYYQVNVEVNVTDKDGNPLTDEDGNLDPNFNRLYKFDGTFDANKKEGLNNKDVSAPLTYLPLPVEQVALETDEAAPESLKFLKVNRIREGINYMVKTSNRVTYVHPFHNRITLARASVDSTTNLNMKRLTDQVIAHDAEVIPYKRAYTLPGDDHAKAMFGVKFTPRNYNFVSDADTPPFSYIGFHASNPYHESQEFSEDEAAALYGRPAGWDEYKYGVQEYSWSEDNGESNFSKKANEYGHMGICLERVAPKDTKPEDIEDAYVAITAEYPVILGYYDGEGENKKFHSHPAIYLADKGMRWSISTDAEEGDYIIDGELIKHPEASEDTPTEAPRRKADGEAPDPDHQEVHQYQTLSTGKVYAVNFEGAETTTFVAEIASAAAGSLKAWPVPAHDTVNLSASVPLGDIEIYAVDGTLVKKDATGDSSVKLDIMTLSPGIYIVHAAGTSIRIVKK